ncbi:MAG: hypothetical protein ABR539_14065, partial [Halomonas sp.]
FAHSLTLQLMLVVLVPGLLALVFGWLAFRSRVTGVYLSILTQAMTLALSLYLFQNDTGLRGINGLSGLQNIPGLLDLPQSTVALWFFWASAAGLGLGYVFFAWLVSDKFGSVIRAIRDNEARVRFLGYHVESYKLAVFTLTAMISGIAGALYYPQAGIINPAEVAPIASIYLAVWVAIGGRGRLYGAIIGAASVSLLSSWFTGGGAFMDIVTGKTRPDAGRVIWGEKSVSLLGMSESAIARAGIGRKFQKPTVFEEQTVRENLRMALKNSRGPLDVLLSRPSLEAEARVA